MLSAMVLYSGECRWQNVAAGMLVQWSRPGFGCEFPYCPFSIVRVICRGTQDRSSTNASEKQGTRS